MQQSKVWSADLFACTLWAYLVHLNFQHMKKVKKKKIINISRCVLWFICFPVCSMPTSGFLMVHRCVSIATFCCCSVGFCIALSVVSTPNSWAIQSEACIYVTKYKHSPFLWKPCWNCFHWEQNEMERKWWRKCQSSEETKVPVEIQIWARHSGVFCFQIFCILLV